MKLITALCDALGFEIETVCVNQDDIDETRRMGAMYSHDPIYEYKLIKSLDSKVNDLGIPKKFIDDNLKKAKGSTMFDIPLEDLTKEELMCCVVASWDDEKKTRAAAINQNRLDLARFFWGKES